VALTPARLTLAWLVPVNVPTAAVAATPVPVLAIGGVTLNRLSGIAATGAAGFAAIGLFDATGPDSVARLQVVVREVSLAFDTPSGVP